MFGKLKSQTKIFIGAYYQSNGQFGKKMVIFLGFVNGKELSNVRKCTSVGNLYKKSHLLI